MHLDKLEIRGFKSFKDKTVLEFPNSFTAIVGPNGSGKTNIVDSICFVLGHSRGLRVSRLEELICNGGIGGNELNSAKVSIYLKGEKETGENGRIKISREIFRDGKCIYEINEKLSSREKVLEIVGDNEYNIIHQNDVTKIIDMKSQERREIIDSLCGISEYEKKKEKAMKELERVEKKISETHIILGEKQGYMENLKKERDEALRYKDISEKVKEAKGSIIFYTLAKEEEKEKKIVEIVESLQKEKDEKTLGIKKIRDKIAEKTKLSANLNQDILKLEESRANTKVSDLRERYVREEQELKHFEETLNSLKKELSEKEEKKKEFSKEIEKINSEIEELQKKLLSVEPQLKNLEKGLIKSSDLLNLQSEADKIKEEILELNSKIKFLDEVKEKNSNEVKELKQKKTEIEKKLKELLLERKNVLQDNEKVLKNEEKRNSELEEEKKTLEEIFVEEKKISEALNSLMIKIAERKAELRALESSPLSEGVVAQSILKIKSVVSGIYGVVSQLGSCSDKKYEKALMIAAGSRIHAIVVENEDTAKKCISYLRKNKIGRATFLPLNKINVKIDRKVPKGAIGFARDFIKCEEKFKKIFDWVFLDTIIVGDIDNAKKIGIGKERMVTLEGDLISREGAISGGYLKEFFAAFSTQDEIKKEISSLENDIAKVSDRKEDIKAEKEKIQKKIFDLEKAMQEEINIRERLKLRIESLNEKTPEIEKEFKRYEEKIKELEKGLKNIENEKKKLEELIRKKEEELRKISLSEESKTKLESLGNLKDEYHKLSIEKNTLEEKHKFFLQQISDLDAEAKEFNKRQKELNAKVKETKEKIFELKKKLDENENREVEFENKIQELMNSKGKIEEEITSLSEGVTKLNLEIEEINEKLNREMIKKAKIETRISDLRKEFKDYEGIKYLEKGISELEEMAEKFGRELAGFGFVNMRAIENYELVKKELSEIEEKLNVLKEERQSIFSFMEKVEQRKKEVFMKTFDVVKKNFEEIFKELGGGKGTLKLDNVSDLSKAGLIIKASPKGKKLVNLDMMSGGEKVLTCSVFLLAIQRYKPSHFYILDELDAALDKENSLKFAEFIKALKTQFILVTHNDMVLKNADSIIGVSMQDGLSQIVGVKLT